jgi:hypothetical protein
LEAFIRDYFLCESPVILSGCIDHWPARKKWKDIKYLESVAGDRTIPVQVKLQTNYGFIWGKSIVKLHPASALIQ